MIVIISPAKKMNVDTDNLAWKDLPMFLETPNDLDGYAAEIALLRSLAK